VRGQHCACSAHRVMQSTECTVRLLHPAESVLTFVEGAGGVTSLANGRTLHRDRQGGEGGSKM